MLTCELQKKNTILNSIIKKMTAKLIVTDDWGKETIVYEDLGEQGELVQMSSIEKFVVSLKTAMLPKLEQSLLEQSGLNIEQELLIKKKRH